MDNFKTYINEILSTETHHNHKIQKINKAAFWKPNKEIVELVAIIGFGKVVNILNENGFGRNSEEMRKLFRGLGWSLFGYWETFYWEVNNPDAKDYTIKKTENGNTTAIK